MLYVDKTIIVICSLDKTFYHQVSITLNLSLNTKLLLSILHTVQLHACYYSLQYNKFINWIVYFFINNEKIIEIFFNKYLRIDKNVFKIPKNMLQILLIFDFRALMLI